MKITCNIQILILLILLPTISWSQSIAKNRADKYYDNMQFSKAIEIYETLQEDNPTDFDLTKRLASANYEMGEYKNALKYYTILIESDEAIAKDWFQYAQLLKINRNDTEAKYWLEKYLTKVPGDLLAKKQLSKLSQQEEHQSAMLFSVRNTSKNSRVSDMSPVIYKGNLVFSSSRDSFSVVGNDYLWNGQPFLDLYTSGFHKSTLYEIRKFSKELNSRFHEGPIVFSKDGNTIYFTRNNYTSGKKRKTSKGLNNLKIYISHWDGEKWMKETEFPYNSNEYSVGHPALSNDDQIIYFVSDMPGGFGKTDIYKSLKTTEGWSLPTNLGSSVNTHEKEMFPTVDSNNNIFFSSDGHPGLGALDIFVANIDTKGAYRIQNLGETLNSTFDDFSMIFDDTGEAGYFTSNRPGGIGDDDLYYFELKGMKLEIIAKNIETQEVLPETTIELLISKKQEARKNTDNNGSVFFNVEVGKEYELWGTKENYIPVSDIIRTNFSEEPIRKEILLKPLD